MGDRPPPADGPAPGGDPAEGGGILTFRELAKGFRSGRRVVAALRNVTLDIRRGCITGVIGPDGAGKTTLMRLAAGLLPPDSGRGRVLGMDIALQAESIQAAVGYMPQRFGLYEDLGVQENLDLYADLKGVAKADRPGRYRELMRMTGWNPSPGGWQAAFPAA